MIRTVDPMVDFAFKRLFGDERNTNLVLHFLNAVVRPKPPLTAVRLLNPTQERETEEDKLSVVDVLATDAEGRLFQIEIQLYRHVGLRARMLYNLTSLYARQLGAGERYTELRPVVSVWLLGTRLTPGERAHRRYRFVDLVDGDVFHDHLELHLLELPKLGPRPLTLDAEARWVYFLKEAGQWRSLPSAFDTPEMRQAMETLQQISQKDEDWVQYFLRAEELSVKATEEHARREAEALARDVEEVRREAEALKREAEALKREVEEARREASAAQRETSAAQREASAAQREAQGLRAQLREAGLTPEH